MEKKNIVILILGLGILMMFVSIPMAFAISDAYKGNIYQVGTLKPIDSVLKVKKGQPAPDFTLPAISGENISLGQYHGKKNVVLSFVPAAWTPVCSDQWPGYNIAKDIFEQNEAILLGITVDNVPTLYAWTNQMGKLFFKFLQSGCEIFKGRSLVDVVDVDITDDPLFVDDKQSSLRNPVGTQHAIFFGYPSVRPEIRKDMKP